MTDEPLDRMADDGYFAERTIYYSGLYPKLREVARQHGYALALHGSLTKDLDVVAVPWVEDAADEATLVKAIVDVCGGHTLPGGKPRGDGTFEHIPARVAKPHGRGAWSIILAGRGGYVDLSVMPRLVSVSG